MQDPGAAFEARWKQWLVERNWRGMRVLLWTALVLYPGFGALDYLLAPREALPFLWTTRGIFVALTIALLVFVSRPIFSRHPDFFSAGYVVAAASGISLMTTFLGGLSSPYYAGLSLVSVATGLIVVWRPQAVMVEAALLLISFIIPNALLHQIGRASCRERV